MFPPFESKFLALCVFSGFLSTLVTFISSLIQRASDQYHQDLCSGNDWVNPWLYYRNTMGIFLPVPLMISISFGNRGRSPTGVAPAEAFGSILVNHLPLGVWNSAIQIFKWWLLFRWWLFFIYVSYHPMNPRLLHWGVIFALNVLQNGTYTWMKQTRSWLVILWI